jgi:plastocyanin
MDKKVAVILAVSVVIMVGGILIYLGSNAHKNNANTGATPAQSAAASGTDEVAGKPVTINDMSFAPQTLNVKVGEKITWTNADSVQHTVTVDEGTGPSSQPLAKGDSYDYTFLKAGTYTYHCSLHPTMKGTIVVSEASQRKTSTE